MKVMSGKTTLIILLAAATIISTSVLYGQDGGASFTAAGSEIAVIMNNIRSPEDLTLWLSKNFTYEMKFPDAPQSVDDMLKFKVGDCDDFARLSSCILSNMNLSNRVIVISFKGLPIKHCICAFRDEEGRYSFMSNKELIRTEEKNLEDALLKIYPDIKRFEYADSTV
jgi:hypothetical protein